MAFNHGKIIRRFKARLAGAGCLVAAGIIQAQSLLPNGGFETGQSGPSSWRISDGGQGAWAPGGRTGQRCVAVTGNGKGSGFWRSETVRTAPGSLYQFRFWGKNGPNTSGGCGVAGSPSVNRDFRFSEEWVEYDFIFTPPVHGTNEYFRLGHWEQSGTTYFDDASLVPVLPVHTLVNGLELGEGESIGSGVYRSRINLGGPGANYHRNLWENRCGFNSDRWTFGRGSQVTYRYQAPGGFKSARLKTTVNYYAGGQLLVLASRSGTEWESVGTMDGARTGEFEIPAACLSGEAVFIRLAGDGPACNLQVNSLDLEAPLKQALPDGQGKTAYFEVTDSLPELAVRLTGLSWRPDRGGHLLDCLVSNLSAKPLKFEAVIADGHASAQPDRITTLPPRTVTNRTVFIPAREPGLQAVALSFKSPGGQALFAVRTSLGVGLLNDPRPGYWLAETPALGAWWCESGRKIGRERGMPPRPASGRAQPVKISAARGEYEAAQVVLHPRQDLEIQQATISPWRDRRGRPAQIEVELFEVAYVRVTRPTDNTGEPGWYPDPLPPLQTPLKLSAKVNQPLWLAFHVKRELAAGEYRGTLQLQTSAGNLSIPLLVEVYDFELPQETHLKSAFGLGTGDLSRYHNLTNAAQRAAVHEKYLDNFARHRIAPYSFFDFAPMDIRFTGTGADRRAQVDFTRFDAAAKRWLDERNFSSFMLPLRGMGGGTFHSRHLGELEGFKEGTPEHARLFQDYLSQVERHLRDHGWLDKAYTYWFDEPDPKDYEFVVDGMKRIKAAAPGLRRMLTEQPEKELLGHVEIWCGLTPEWTPEKVAARRAAGEEVWWYICCAPHAPYATEFIDHAGTELRLWPWQSWQYGVQGILVWATTYWTSSAAFPNPQRQNPWEDPMSYVSGYDFKPGHLGYWGNGDGRFLYPPRAALTNAAPNLEAPVTSFRWENLRDGMEDYEYLWRLRQQVDDLKQTGRKAALVREAEALLAVPASVSKDTRNFTTDPRALLAQREKLARMIERLAR